MADTQKACTSCHATPTGDDGGCAKCGWNGTLGARRCLRCRELVDARPDFDRLKLPGGAALVVAGVVGMLGGFLGSLAFGLGAAAVGSGLLALDLHQRCGGCGVVVPERMLIEGERTELRDRRATLFMRGGLMAIGSAIAGFLWLQAALATAHAPAGAAPRAAESGAQRAPDIAVLEAARDSEALAVIVEREPLHREAAGEALGRLGDTAVPALLALLPRADEHAKRTALVVLERLAPRTDRALDALVLFVQTEPSSHLRAQAIDVLGKAGPVARRAVPVLEPLLADYQMGGTAESALRRIAPDTDWSSKRAALRAK